MGVANNEKPYFSIVIPAFNREKEIERAINSCLVQGFEDIEIVIVDDGSKDRTVPIIQSINDKRIVLICHQTNKGACAARNTGITHCRGEWIVFLDSDDEFLPGAFETIRRRTLACPDDVGRLSFMYRRDDGRLSPEPALTDCDMDYETYLAWLDGVTLWDYVFCTRSHTFERIKFNEGRFYGGYEHIYMLDFVKQYKVRMVPEIVAVYHFDSTNHSSSKRGDFSAKKRIDKVLGEARAGLLVTEVMLSRHREALDRHAPKRYRLYLKAQVQYSFLAGERWQGCRLAYKYLKDYPGCVEGWVILMAGIAGPRMLAKAKLWKQ